MKRVIIVQARMTSSRLPGKVLLEVGGRPMLAQQLRRLRQCRRADEIMVATTTNATDDPLVRLAEAENVRWFRGSESDVLARYAGAAREAQADLVVRVTADCPLIDPEITDGVIAELENHPAEGDYASNVIERTYPRGLDTEAFFRDVLERANRLGHSPASREHVTHFILREQPGLFLRRSVTDVENNADLRWTVDEPRDLELMRRLYAEVGLGERAVSYRELLAYVRARPDLAGFNAAVEQARP